MSLPSCYAYNNIFIKRFFWRFHYNKESLPDFRFSQWCCKWLKSSGLWHCHWACSSWLFDASWSHPVHCQAVINVIAVWSHEASVITCPTTQYHIAEDLNFQEFSVVICSDNICSFTSGVACDLLSMNILSVYSHCVTIFSGECVCSKSKLHKSVWCIALHLLANEEQISYDLMYFWSCIIV